MNKFLPLFEYVRRIADTQRGELEDLPNVLLKVVKRRKLASAFQYRPI